jgi:tryptophanyl-tRNA synthetase
MRPTGKLHLGHLVGALDNWVKLQDEYECFFMIADWHAYMSEYENASQLTAYSLDNCLDWLSVGIDPNKATVFIQSEVGAHLDLYMIFSCLTPLGWLERCPTYKEQLREIKTRDINTYGFLGYPVLQAADILVYRADKVPVGEDQLPHLELTREIARRFNNLYQKEVFPCPDALLTQTPRLLGLDGRKMSKSYDNTINLSDPPDSIEKKVSTMITDPQRIKLSDKGHPDICNVFSYYATFLPQLRDDVYDWCTNAKVGCTACKKKLAEGLQEKLKPLQEKRNQLSAHPNKIREILREGRDKALKAASQTVQEAKQAMGI